MAIETGLVVRMVYKLAYRQTEGFLHSIALLLGLGIEIPDYSTLSRRSRLLRKKLRIPKAASNQPIHLRTVAEIISHSWMDATCSSTSAGKRIF